MDDGTAAGAEVRGELTWLRGCRSNSYGLKVNDLWVSAMAETRSFAFAQDGKMGAHVDKLGCSGSQKLEWVKRSNGRKEILKAGWSR